MWAHLGKLARQYRKLQLGSEERPGEPLLLCRSCTPRSPTFRIRAAKSMNSRRPRLSSSTGFEEPDGAVLCRG